MASGTIYRMLRCSGDDLCYNTIMTGPDREAHD